MKTALLSILANGGHHHHNHHPAPEVRGRQCYARRFFRQALLALPVLFWVMSTAHAHLMAAQKGTLNITGNAAFLVLSVPVSALHGVDNDGDGALSGAELAAHTGAIREQVNAGVQLSGPAGLLPLQLMMLDIASAETTPAGPARHLVVLGRFALDSTAIPVTQGLTLRFALFGALADEREQNITVTREQETQWLRFTPSQDTRRLLPGAATVFVETVASGASHVLQGADHLLFLLVVLSAGWHWRALLGALTCFTAGHAITLAACIWGGWSVPGWLIEPAIAATIIGLATFDGWCRWKRRTVPAGWRLLMVFCCALIHGMGLASALSDLTPWMPGSPQMVMAVAGFNAGIELAQIGVAALAGLFALALQRLTSPAARMRLLQTGSAAGMLTGLFWLMERLGQGS